MNVPHTCACVYAHAIMSHGDRPRSKQQNNKFGPPGAAGSSIRRRMVSVSSTQLLRSRSTSAMSGVHDRLATAYRRSLGNKGAGDRAWVKCETGAPIADKAWSKAFMLCLLLMSWTPSTFALSFKPKLDSSCDFMKPNNFLATSGCSTLLAPRTLGAHFLSSGSNSCTRPGPIWGWKVSSYKPC